MCDAFTFIGDVIKSELERSIVKKETHYCKFIDIQFLVKYIHFYHRKSREKASE